MKANIKQQRDPRATPSDIISDSLSDIEERRSVAGLSDGQHEWRAADQHHTGLALSGGGIRSAFFNLGLLQAFSHRGLLKYFDFLSSVSGGSYIAGHLFSVEHQRAQFQRKEVQPEEVQRAEDQPEANQQSSFHDSKEAKLGVDPQTGQLDPQDYAFHEGGRHLCNRLVFWSRYLFSTTFTVALAICLLGFLCTAMALYWRAFDSYPVRRALSMMNLHQIADELFFAFIPCLLATSLSVVTLAGALARRWSCQTDTTNTARFLTAAAFLSAALLLLPLIWGLTHLIMSAPLALIALICVINAWHIVNKRAISDGKLNNLWKRCACLVVVSVLTSLTIFLGNSVTSSSSASATLSNFTYLNRFAMWVGILAAFFQILTLVGLDRLFRSDREEAPKWQKFVFKGVNLATVLLPFLAMMYWMGREDISKATAFHTPDLGVEAIMDWDVFLHTVQNAYEFQRVGKVNNSLNSKELSEVDEGLSLAKAAQKEHSNLEDEIDGLIDPQEPDGDPWKNRLNQPLVSARGTGWLITQLASGEIKRVYNLEQKLCKSVLNSPDRVDTSTESENRLLPLLNRQLADSKFCANLVIQLAVEMARESSERPIGLADDLAQLPARLINAPEKETDEPADERRRTYLADSLASLDTVYPAGATTAETIKEALDTWQPAQRARLGRLTLEELAPQGLMPFFRDSTYFVNRPDQRARWHFLAAWFLASVVLIAVIRLRRFSPMHQFYTQALGREFLSVTADDRAAEILTNPYIKELEPHKSGLALPLFGVSKLRRVMDRFGPAVERQRAIFSPYGLASYNDAGTQAVEYAQRNLPLGPKLNEVIATSGAAVCPLVTEHLPLTLLMEAFNLRLGAWYRFQSPGRRDQQPVAQRLDPSPMRVFDLHIRPPSLRSDRQDTTWFVADGGHTENLGAEELLVRRCSLIVVSDAGNNYGQHEFSNLASFVRRARKFHGIRFLDLDEERPIDLNRFREFGRIREIQESASGDSPRPARDSTATSSAAESKQVPQQFLACRIKYPDREGYGLLVYVRMALTGREEVDLQQFRRNFPDFPDEPTVNQWYTKDQVESYRQLGYWIGERVCVGFPNERQKVFSPEQLARSLKHAYLSEVFEESGYESDDLTRDAIMSDFETIDANLNLDFRQKLEQRADKFFETPWVRNPEVVDARGKLDWVVGARENSDWIDDPQVDDDEFVLRLLNVSLVCISTGASEETDDVLQVGGRSRLVDTLWKYREGLRLPVQNVTDARRWLLARYLVRMASTVCRPSVGPRLAAHVAQIILDLPAGRLQDLRESIMLGDSDAVYNNFKQPPGGEPTTADPQ